MVLSLALAATMLSPAPLALPQEENPFRFRDPAPKSEERARFMFPDVTAQPMAQRLAAYEQRVRMRESSPFRAMTWRNVGPESQGGRVIDIAVPRSDPSSVYIAFATGGLWRTRSEGQTWEPLFDDQSAFGIGDLDITADGKTIFLGTGEANSQRTSYAGTGVFKSTDSGRTWTNVGLNESHHIGRVKIDPRDPNIVWVAALGPLYSQGGQRGLYKTTDGGRTWNLVLKGDGRTGAMDVQLDPRNGNHVYATLWERDRRAWNFLDAGPGSGSFKSIDGGRTWTRLSLPQGDAAGRTTIAIAPSKPDVVYAFQDNWGGDEGFDARDERAPSGRMTVRRFASLSPKQIRELDTAVFVNFVRSRLPQGVSAEDTVRKVKAGEMSLTELRDIMLRRDPDLLTRPINHAQLWRSDDAGKTWRLTRDDLGEHGGYYWNEVVVHPFKPDTVWTTGVDLLMSEDGGKNFVSRRAQMHVDFHAYWVDFTNPMRHITGNDGGPYISNDGGVTWRNWNNLPVGQTTTLAVDDKTPYNVITGMQDNGTMRGPSTYRPGVSRLDSWTDLFGGDGSFIQVDPRGGGDLVYVAFQFGQHYAVNTTANERRYITPRPAQGQPEFRFNWISPLQLSSFHPDILYLGSQFVHRSFDQGRTWQIISPDLTRNREQGNVPHSTLTALVESPLRFGRLYAGADDGSLHTTPDGGLSWIPIPTPQPQRWITRIVPSRFAEGRVYVTQNGYRQNEWTAMVWVSEDFGKSWRSLAAGLPAESVNTIREDPTNPNILYVGTNLGVYFSLDRGGSWMTLGSGMPNNPVHDLQIQPRAQELVAATHGRSCWVLPLRWVYALNDEQRAKPFASLDLQVPTGRDSWGYEPAAPFADPRSVDRNVVWTFWHRAGGSGRLDLVAADGTVVVSRSLSVVNGFNVESLNLLLAPADPSAPAAPPSGTNDPFAARRAKYVPKGDYTLRLTVGSQVDSVKVAVN